MFFNAENASANNGFVNEENEFGPKFQETRAFPQKKIRSSGKIVCA